MLSRRLLLTAVSVLALVAVAALLFVFTESLSPAFDKQRPYLEIHIDEINPGSFRTVNWKGKPFVIVRTSEEILADLKNLTVKTWSQNHVLDEPMFFIFSMISTNRGCGIVHASKGTRYPPEEKWPGGFYDPCHFGVWDYAGRSIKQFPDQPSYTRLPDLEVPPYEIRSKSIVRLL